MILIANEKNNRERKNMDNMRSKRTGPQLKIGSKKLLKTIKSPMMIIKPTIRVEMKI